MMKECKASSALIWLKDDVEEPQWILDQLSKGNWMKGKLTCPKCGGKIGGFDFISPSRCDCGLHMNPSIYLTVTRVDRDRPVSMLKPTTNCTLLAQRPVLTKEESGDIAYIGSRTESIAVAPSSSVEIDLLLENDLRQDSGDNSAVRLRRRNQGRLEYPVPGENLEPLNEGGFPVNSQERLEFSVQEEFLESSHLLDTSADTLERTEGSGPVENSEILHGISGDVLGAVTRGISIPLSNNDSRRLTGIPEVNGTNLHTLLPTPDSEISDSSVSSWFLETSSTSSTSHSDSDTDTMINTSSRQLQQRQNQFSVLEQNVNERDREENDSSSDEKSTEITDLELIKQMEGLTCSICLDLYYRPHSCYPCHHVFCESCLRQIANSRPSDTVCPLCRTEIKKCILHEELEKHIKSRYPEDYKHRLKEGRKLRLKHMPLPHRKWNPSLDLEYQHQMGWNSYKTELAVVFMMFFVVAMLALSSFPMVLVLHGGEP